MGDGMLGRDMLVGPLRSLVVNRQAWGVRAGVTLAIGAIRVSGGTSGALSLRGHVRTQDIEILETLLGQTTRHTGGLSAHSAFLGDRRPLGISWKRAQLRIMESVGDATVYPSDGSILARLQGDSEWVRRSRRSHGGKGEGVES